MTDTSTKAMSAVPRPGSTLVSFWALIAIGVLFVGDVVVRGDWSILAVVIAPALLVCWAAWLMLYRPQVFFDKTRAVVVNPGRITEVPWERSAGVVQRLQLVIELDEGKGVTCWGSPFPEKPGRTRRDPNRRTVVGGDVAGPLEAARAAANAAHPDGSGAPVTRRFDVVPLAVGAILIVACAIELAIVR